MQGHSVWAPSREGSVHGASALPPPQATSGHGHLLWVPSLRPPGKHSEQDRQRGPRAHFPGQELRLGAPGELCPVRASAGGVESRCDGPRAEPSGPQCEPPHRGGEGGRVLGRWMQFAHWDEDGGPSPACPRPPGLAGPGPQDGCQSGGEALRRRGRPPASSLQPRKPFLEADAWSLTTDSSRDRHGPGQGPGSPPGSAPSA